MTRGDFQGAAEELSLFFLVAVVAVHFGNKVLQLYLEEC